MIIGLMPYHIDSLELHINKLFPAISIKKMAGGCLAWWVRVGRICFWSGRSRQRASGVLANIFNLDLGHGFISVHFVIIC